MPTQALPCFACQSSRCRLSRCAAAENRSQCGDQGDWSSSEGLTQSCLLPQCCGSGTLHRWKTEEGEWVITRVLAPLCPHKKKKSTAHNRGLRTSLSCEIFSRPSLQSFAEEKHRRGGKRNTKKQHCPPNSSKYRLKAPRSSEHLQREEVFWFCGG